MRSPPSAASSTSCGRRRSPATGPHAARGLRLRVSAPRRSLDRRDLGRGLFRGVVDKSAAEVKRLIRSGRINAVSVHYGNPRSERGTIIDLEPLSIDVVPLGRQGMTGAVISGWETRHLAGEASDQL